MTHSNEAYSRLRGITLENLTVEQMDSVLGPSSISPNINGQFEQAQMLAGAVAAQRTYAGNLPIPELSGITTSGSLAAGETFDFQPSGTEEWEIIGISGTSVSGTPTGGVFLYDGSESVVMHTGSTSAQGVSLFPFESAFTITNTLYLRCINMDGSISQTFNVAFHKVSL